MSRQIRRQHRKTMMREVAVMQRPGRVIHACAVQQHHDGLRGIERLAAGAGKHIEAVDFQLHGSAPKTQSRCEARNACDRSSMMSAANSMPTESRTKSSPTPAAASCAASIC